MFELIFASIFISFVVIVYARETTTLYNSSITARQARQELVKISKPVEALPVVLFERSVSGNMYQYTLHDPEEIVKVETLDGKMVTGTEFSTTGSGNQRFFCPKEDPKERCLVPQNFEDSKNLRCSKEPIPVLDLEHIREIRYRFGAATCYGFIYKICPSEEFHNYVTLVIRLYEFCYDKELQKTLYTSHYIRSPKLLQSNLLLREQEVIYNFSADNSFHPAYYEAIINSLVGESNQASTSTASRPMYQVQKLAPSEDMALATWIKPFYKFVNAELQHQAIFHVWNDINRRVREKAIEMYDSDIKFLVRTGVFEVFDITKDVPVNDGQIYNMWVKMIISTSKDGSQIFQGVVFLVNNFLNSGIRDSEGNLLQEKIETYCPRNLCFHHFTSTVTNAGGQMRCCPFTKEIADLFGIHYRRLQVLQFSGLL